MSSFLKLMNLINFYLKSETDIDEFISNFRSSWPGSMAPKLHMLEAHVVPFLNRWRTGCGFYGEQGGESIHHAFKQTKSRYVSIKNANDRLRYTMEEHLRSVSPKVSSVRVRPEKRRKRVDI